MRDIKPVITPKRTMYKMKFFKIFNASKGKQREKIMNPKMHIYIYI